MDHRQYWMPDSLCKECYDCGNPFNALRRRHHCRVCGQIFCWRCCSDVVPGHMVGQTTDQRCCTYCARVIREYRVGQQQQQDDVGANNNNKKKKKEEKKEEEEEEGERRRRRRKKREEDEEDSMETSAANVR